MPTARKVIELLLEANARNERRIAALEREVKEHKEQLGKHGVREASGWSIFAWRAKSDAEEARAKAGA